MDNNIRKKADFLINTAFYVVAIALVYFLFKYVASWFMPFIVAFCIVSIVRPLVKKITAILHIKHEVIAVIVMAAVYILFGYAAIILAIKIASMLMGWFASLPSYFESTLAPMLISTGNIISRTVREIPFLDEINIHSLSSEIISTARNFIVGFSQKGLSLVTGFSKGVPNFFIALIFTVMLSFFISIHYEAVVSFIRAQLPPKGKQLLADFKHIFVDTVSKYFKAVGKIIAITCIELCIGFSLLGVENPIGIALVITVFDALPVLGTGGIVIPWAIIELILGNYPMALGLIILYGVVLVVRNIVEPKIVGDQLGLNPVLSLVVIYIGFRIFGVFGMIFMPITAQIFLAMHKNGNIKLYKSLETD